MLKRTHNCGQLQLSDAGKQVILTGWAHWYRNHGNLIFIDIRDREGLTQLVFNSDTHPDTHKIAATVRCEWVIAAKGTVQPRSTANPKLSTGQIEVAVEQFEIINVSATPPFEMADAEKTTEELRLTYRYIDLRRHEMLEKLQIRHRVTKIVRDYFDQLGFWEVETPVLAKSTPEGARDFLVPSRQFKNCFYALPQSPQLFKQILMVSSVDRYFQVARCFRDEDPRADRQAEFTQIDVEASFVDTDDIISIHEVLVAKIWKDILAVDVRTPMLRMTYNQAMAHYGTDRPDLRFDMKLKDISDIAAECTFKVFTAVLEKKGVVKGLCAPAGQVYSRHDIDKTLTVFAAEYGAKGLASLKVTAADTGLTCETGISKFFTPAQYRQIIERFAARDGDLILLVADDEKTANKALAPLRCKLAKDLKLYDENTFEFVWIVDFPLFEWNPDLQRYDSLHHPFTAPSQQEVAMLDTDPASVYSQAYDIVVNGAEIGGGSIRIHNPKLQQKVFKLLGISEKQALQQFGFFLKALNYGAPPHGGIALGLDRIIMLLTGTDNIKDVIAFPKTHRGQCLLSNAPGQVDQKQLDELNLRTQRHSHSIDRKTDNHNS